MPTAPPDPPTRPVLRTSHPRPRLSGLWAPEAALSFLRSQLHICARGRNRTCDTSFRKRVLYPLSYAGN